MSYSGERFSIPHLKSVGIAVSECGITENSPGHAVGPRVYGEYSAHFVLSGKGTVTSDGESFRLGAGEGFMIMPYAVVDYKADENEPWIYIYVNFYGTDCSMIVHSAGITEDKITFTFDPQSGILGDLNRVHSLSRDQSGGGYDVTGAFLIVMSRLVRENVKKTEEQFFRNNMSAARCRILKIITKKGSA